MNGIIIVLWRVFCMWRKEVLDLLKNPANRIVLVAPVIIQSVVFGYAATYDLNDAPYALVDQSGGEAARDFAARLDGTGLFRRVAAPATPEGIAAAMDRGDILLGIQIGQDFDSRLSAGQRQLISFARALLACPNILIMDEATSSIDTETEILLQKGLNRLLEGRTSFIIAHRLSTIKNADEILYVDKGGIVERGNHEELMAKRGEYYRLQMAQKS